MTLINEANQLRLKKRPDIILEFDPPRWDYEEVKDTVGRVYLQDGLKVYKLPGDLPEDTDLETIEPVTINPDGTVQEWFYTCTSDPNAETTQNRNRRFSEELEAARIVKQAFVTQPVPTRKPKKFDRELRALDKSLKTTSKIMGFVIPVLLVVWALVQGISSLSNNTTPKQVTVKLTLLPEVSFQYTLPANQITQQIRPYSLPLSVEADGEATETVEIADANAKGKVRFVNAGTTPLTLPSGTVIASVNGINYKVVENVTIPGLNIQAARAGFADATVQADQAGPQGNLPGGIGAFAFRSLVSVNSLGPVSGGTNRTVQVVAAGDVERIKTKLQAQASQRATENFDRELASDQKRWGVVELEQPEFTLPDVGSVQPSGKFKGNLTLQLIALSYRPDELLRLATPAPSMLELPLEYGTAHFKALSKDLQGNFLVSYTRSLQMVKQARPFPNWQGSRVEFDKLLAELKTKPGLNFVSITGDLPQDWQGQVQITFQLN